MNLLYSGSNVPIEIGDVIVHKNRADVGKGTVVGFVDDKGPPSVMCAFPESDNPVFRNGEFYAFPQLLRLVYKSSNKYPF